MRKTLSNVIYKTEKSIIDKINDRQIMKISNEKKPLGYLMASILFD
tara:strand:- start:470 stop:607 length:138 start_codon:yes stop_codon:yes gene_type:complete